MKFAATFYLLSLAVSSVNARIGEKNNHRLKVPQAMIIAITTNITRSSLQINIHPYKFGGIIIKWIDAGSCQTFNHGNQYPDSVYYRESNSDRMGNDILCFDMGNNFPCDKKSSPELSTMIKGDGNVVTYLTKKEGRKSTTPC